MKRGFTLLEMLITVLVFSIMIIAIYGLFDQGQWLYLHSEKRANIQDMSRNALEGLERELRMAGSGVPGGGQMVGGAIWTPYVFHAGVGEISFRADIDSGNSMVRADETGDSDIDVHDASVVCPGAGETNVQGVLVKDLKGWDPITCSSFAGNLMTVDDTEACTASECEVFTPEHIFYRLAGDGDLNGICDSISNADYPFCTLERAEIRQNTPTSTVPTDDQFAPVATNVIQIQFEYLDADGDVTPNPFAVGQVRVNLRTRDRTNRVGVFQDINLTSVVKLRRLF